MLDIQLHDHCGTGGRAGEPDHDRMPVILDQAAYDALLVHATTPVEAKALLKQKPNSRLEFDGSAARSHTSDGQAGGIKILR